MPPRLYLLRFLLLFERYDASISGTVVSAFSAYLSLYRVDKIDPYPAAMIVVRQHFHRHIVDMTRVGRNSTGEYDWYDVEYTVRAAPFRSSACPLILPDS